MGDYYRGGNSRRPPKRRARDDDDDGDYRRGGRYEREDTLSKLKREAISIAESPLVKIEDAVKTVATGFTSNFENEEIRNGLLDTLHSLVLDQPFKVPFVAAIVLVANAENSEVGKAVVEHFSGSLQKNLDHGAFTNVKLLLRFFACLGDMLEDKGAFLVLEHLADKVEACQTTGAEALGVLLTYIVLITLPYVVVAPGRLSENDAYEMLKRTEKFAKKHHSMQSLQDPFSGGAPPYDNRAKGANMAEILWWNLEFYITGEGEDDFSSINCLPQPWKAFNTEIMAATKHALPEIIIPKKFPPNANPVAVDVYFSVFADQPIETVPPPMDLASTIFRDGLVDTIDILDCNRLTVSRFLIEIDCFFNPKSFIRRATAYDRVAEVAGDSDSTWKPEDVAVDAIFSQLFKLPQPAHKLVYYHSILTEICKLAPAAIAPSLGRAIRFMYRNVESLDTELIYRFTDWFSHHLSNFGYTWKWQEWSEHLMFPDVQPKKAFILGALEKEIRLSFATRIKGTLPEQFKELIPEEREKEQPVFKFDIESETFATEGKELLHCVADRKEDAEVDVILNKITAAAAEKGLAKEDDPGAIARDAYITVICHIGAKSLSHVLSCIERCKEKLLAIGQEHVDARKQIVQSVLAYWHDQPGIGANVVDKLLNYSIVTPISVVDWVLRDAGVEALSKVHAWEMVATTIGKVNNRVLQIRAARPAVEGEGITEEQKKVYEDTLKGAEMEQGIILKAVTEALENMAEQDVTENGEMVDVESLTWIQWWARGWLRAFRRKFGVDEFGQGPTEPEIATDEIMGDEPAQGDGVVKDDVVQDGTVKDETGSGEAAHTTPEGMDTAAS